jgi:hypothetical protein
MCMHAAVGNCVSVHFPSAILAKKGIMYGWVLCCYNTCVPLHYDFGIKVHVFEAKSV